MTDAITPANLLFVILFVNRYVATSSDADAKNGITLWLPKIKNDDESKNNVTELFQLICSGGQFSVATLTNFQSSWRSSEFMPSYDNAVKADKITIIAMNEYFFGKSIEGNLIDFNLIIIATAKTKTPVTIIGKKNIPGSNELISRLNCGTVVIGDVLSNEEYSEGNNAGIMDKVVIEIENKNTRCEIFGILEIACILIKCPMFFYVLKQS